MSAASPTASRARSSSQLKGLLFLVLFVLPAAVVAQATDDAPKTRLFETSSYLRYEGGYDGLHHSRYILDSVAAEIKNNTQDRLFIVIYVRDSTTATKRKIAASKRELDFVLFKLHKLPRDGVTVVNGPRGKALIEYYMIPPGAEPPKTDGPLRIEPENKVAADGNACELNALYLDNLGVELANDPNISLHIIFSPGRTETAAVNAKRQKIFVEKIKKRFTNLKFEMGEKTGGLGEVALYLPSLDGSERYFLRIQAIRNKSICLNCCDAGDKPKSLAAKKRASKS